VSDEPKPPTVAAPARPEGESNWTPTRIALVAVLTAVGLLALSNLDKTNVSFIFFDVSAPLFLVIVGTLAIGFAAGYYFRDVRARRRANAQ
jgi:uncharacterized integral membrane protein